jgi:penicillin-binding protein 1A
MRKYINPNARGGRQGRVDRVIAAGDVIRLRKNNKDSWILTQVPTVGGALVSIAPTDGAIRAVSGGYEFNWSKFNRATDARRQPGSTYKPFVYAAALGKGYTPASLVSDTKKSFGRWKPKNADGKYMGTVRMRVALAKSRNLAVINLIDRMGIDYTRDFLQRFGYTMEDMPRNYGLALGGGSSTPLQLAAAYAVFANGGYKVEPHVVSRIEDTAGNLLYEADAPRACVDCWLESNEGEAEVTALDQASRPMAQQVLDPRIAYNMDSMLKDVIKVGTARRARSLNRSDLAGKTGTTNDSVDSWFAGYSPHLVTVAWMGMDDNRPLGYGEWGGTAALGMWVDFMADALDGEPIAKIKRPEGMVPVRVSASTGRATKGGEDARVHPQRVPADDARAGAGEVRRCVGRLQRREHVTAPCSERQPESHKEAQRAARNGFAVLTAVGGSWVPDSDPWPRVWRVSQPASSPVRPRIRHLARGADHREGEPGASIAA